MADRPTPRARPGRGALSNIAGRFERRRVEAVEGEDWNDDLPPPRLDTEVRLDPARRVISTNDSPDVPFEQSINPYRGCEHGCVYCAAGDTPILYADGRHRPLGEVRVGDAIIGTFRVGWYRRYAETRVLNHWSTIKPAYRITLADGTKLVTSGDHRFLTERGWKFVKGQEHGHGRRPHLTLNNSLMGTGRFTEQPVHSEDYRRGYLCGLIRGDGHLGACHNSHPSRAHDHLHVFRLALVDSEALQRARSYLETFGLQTHEFQFQTAVHARRPMRAIRTNAKAQVQVIGEIVRWQTGASDDWRKGFLAGIFDAEGHKGGKNAIRISNTDSETVDNICKAMDRFGFSYRLEPIERDGLKPLTVVRLQGGLAHQLRFFHMTDPAITRKRTIAGLAVKNDADLRVASVEPLNRAMRLYDITTATGDFIANGVISHNCYARPSHACLNLSPGLDFETKLFYKQDAAERLREELARPGYNPRAITLGANTDPYQPIERRYRVTRSLLEVLLACRHPCSLITKSALIERDLDLLGELAQHRLVSVMVSVTTLDAALKRTLEPRTASPRRRLETIRRLTAAGIPTGALIAPVIPVLTDHELEAIVEAVAAAGARSAGYVLLRLPHEVAPLFREWLAEHQPLRAAPVMNRLREARGGRDYDSRYGERMRGTGVYAELLAQRFRLACRRHGLAGRARLDLDASQFRPPSAGGQLDLGLAPSQ